MKPALPSLDSVKVAGVLAVGALLAWAAWRIVREVQTKGLGGAVAGAADAAVSVPVYAVGDVLGIPRTDDDACDRAAGLWEASKVCSAGRFLRGDWGSRADRIIEAEPGGLPSDPADPNDLYNTFPVGA